MRAARNVVFTCQVIRVIFSCNFSLSKVVFSVEKSCCAYYQQCCKLLQKGCTKENSSSNVLAQHDAATYNMAVNTRGKTFNLQHNIIELLVARKYYPYYLTGEQ